MGGQFTSPSSPCFTNIDRPRSMYDLDQLVSTLAHFDYYISHSCYFGCGIASVCTFGDGGLVPVVTSEISRKFIFACCTGRRILFVSTVKLCTFHQIPTSFEIPHGKIPKTLCGRARVGNDHMMPRVKLADAVEFGLDSETGHMCLNCLS